MTSYLQAFRFAVFQQEIVILITSTSQQNIGHLCQMVKNNTFFINIYDQIVVSFVLETCKKSEYKKPFWRQL